MTKEQLAKLGIIIEEDSVDDEKALELIGKKNTERDADLKKHKDLLSARNSEIAEFKRKEQEKLSEEEKTKLHYEDLEKTNKDLTRKLALNDKITEYISLGYDAELAKKVAEAELDGKSTIEFRKQFVTAQQEKIKADLLKNGKDPETNKDKTITKADLDKMGYEDLLKVQETNPALYNEWASEKK